MYAGLEPGRRELYASRMSAKRSYSDAVAANLLNRYGLAAIWQLHLSAARAHRDGNRMAARSIMEIADAAEREWLRRSVDNRTGSASAEG